jgi:hypothetical protein
MSSADKTKLDGIVLQSSAGDETSGRVLTNGAHGLGRRGNAITDMNLTPPDGASIYHWATDSASNRPTGILRGAAITARWGALRGGQLAFGDGAGGLGSGIAVRTTADSGATWGSWLTVMTDATIGNPDTNFVTVFEAGLV